MYLDPVIKQNWERLQARHDHPVDSVGFAIHPDDDATLDQWHAEGINSYMIGQRVAR